MFNTTEQWLDQEQHEVNSGSAIKAVGANKGQTVFLCSALSVMFSNFQRELWHCVFFVNPLSLNVPCLTLTDKEEVTLTSSVTKTLCVFLEVHQLDS